MKRYLIPIIMAILVLTSGIVVGCAKSEPIIFPDKPRQTEKQMTYALYDYFFAEFDFYWARPLFLVDDLWSAYYKGEGMWLVKAYDIDRSYAGTWLVPEAAHYGKDYDRVEPFDNDAKAIASGGRRIGKMPPIPPFLRSSNRYREDMIMAVQQYIASMSRKQAEDAFITEIWQALRTHYPLDWHIAYNDSHWILVADYYEYRVSVFIIPSTGEMTVSGGFAPF